MINKTFIVVTNNSEKYIDDVLWSLLPLEEDEELIIFDNLSSDETVPKIVNKMGQLWLDKNQRYKFYINMKKATRKELINKSILIARGKPIIINKRKKFKIEEVIKNVKNK